jgi:predicted MFS family arabinose efflux permease
MTVPSGLRALRHRDFRVFFAGQAVALVGSWMQQVAQAWLVLSLTNSPLRLGLVGSLNFLPILLFALVGGAVADRLPKRRLLVGTQSLLLAQTLTLALLIVTDHVRYWHVCALALVWGIANTIDLPVRQAFIVELAGRDDVTSAVALNSAAFNVARIVGPAVGGLLIARAGVAPAYFINAGAFVVVIAALLTVRARGAPSPRAAGATLGGEIREGLAYALRTRRILVLLAVLFVISITVFNFSIYVPVFARQVVRRGPEGFGLLMASVGTGAVGGALTLGALRAPSLQLLFATGFLSCLGLLTMSTVERFGVAAMVLFALGWVSVMVVAGCQAALQLAAPDRLRGRIMSLHTFIYGGVFPFGAFTVGSISERWGVPWAFRLAGLFGLTTLGLVLLWWRARTRPAAAAA